MTSTIKKIIYCAVGSLLLASIAILFWVTHHLHKPFLEVGDSNQTDQYQEVMLCGSAAPSIQVSINPGDSLRTVIKTIKSINSNHPLASNISIKLLWYSLFKNPPIKTGIYTIPLQQSLYATLNQFAGGRVSLVEFTLLPGTTIYELIDSINSSKIFGGETLTYEALDATTILTPPFTSLEGAFLPDTYCLAYLTNPVAFLKTAHKALLSKLEPLLEKYPLPKPIKNTHELLTLASIVERETSIDRERTLVSAVYINRLRITMKLQADPTVIYGMGTRYNGNITKKDLLTPTPYNTYTRKGLPPTPIAMVTEKSIYASLNPADVDYLFFVATGKPDKTHNFTKTYGEHKKKVQEYLKKLRNSIK